MKEMVNSLTNVMYYVILQSASHSGVQSIIFICNYIGVVYCTHFTAQMVQDSYTVILVVQYW